MAKIWEFDLDTGTRQFKTWVYSDTGLDIEERFLDTNCKITNIKEKSLPKDNLNDKPITD